MIVQEFIYKGLIFRRSNGNPWTCPRSKMTNQQVDCSECVFGKSRSSCKKMIENVAEHSKVSEKWRKH